MRSCSVIGLRTGMHIELNPPMETEITAEDALILIAHDSAIALSEKPTGPQNRKWRDQISPGEARNDRSVLG